MVPTDRRSSVSYPDCWYFLTTCATSRRFRLISTSLASRSPSLQRLKYSRSSCALSGFGNVFKESRLKLHYFILCGGRAAGAFTSFPYFLRLRPAHIPALFPVSGQCLTSQAFSTFCLQRHKGYHLCTTYRPKSKLLFLHICTSSPARSSSSLSSGTSSKITYP